jgi:hypothetical protein
MLQPWHGIITKIHQHMIPWIGALQACTTIIHSWLSRKFVIGVAILFPVAVTFYVTW